MTAPEGSVTVPDSEDRDELVGELTRDLSG